jgi:hypothetical protein
MRLTHFYYTALVCGLAPLVIGVSIFLLWLVTRWDWLAIAGLLTIAGGLLSETIGLGCLITFAIWSWKSPDRPPIGRRVLIALASFWINFPVLFAIFFAVEYFDSTPHLKISNQGPTIDRFFLSGACADAAFGPIPTGATVERPLSVRRDGDFAFKGVHGDSPIGGVVEDAIMLGDTAGLLLEFNREGHWTVQRYFRPDILSRVWPRVWQSQGPD